MAKLLLSYLKKDRQIYLFVILGIILIAFPDRIAAHAPYVVGVALILYAIVNIIMELRYPESEIRPGDAVIRGVVGIILLLEFNQDNNNIFTELKNSDLSARLQLYLRLYSLLC